MIAAPKVSIVACSAKTRRGIPCATIGIASLVHKVLSSQYPSVKLIDLGTIELPTFDGREINEYKSPSLQNLAEALTSSKGILWIVPCYWQNAGSLFINSISLLAGPGYSNSETMASATPFSGKLMSLITVGADNSSAGAGAEVSFSMFGAIRARTVGIPVVINNPRNTPISSTDASAILRCSIGLLQAVITDANCPRSVPV